MGSIRHAYLLNRIACDERAELAGRDVWRGKQEAQPGTPLATTFPFYTRLIAVGYTTKEDLDGATANELMSTVGLNQRDTDIVLAAFAKL